MSTFTSPQQDLLQAKVAKLKAGNYVKATFDYGDSLVAHIEKLKQGVQEQLYFKSTHQTIRDQEGSASKYLTDVELLPMPEPPVGSYVRSAKYPISLFYHDSEKHWYRVGSSTYYIWEQILKAYPDLVLCEVRDV